MKLIGILCAAVMFAQAPGRLAPGTGIVTGTIQMDSGAPMSGVRVGVVSVDDPTGANLISLGETDAAGHYKLTDIPQGSYYVVAGRLSSLSFFPGGTDKAKATEVKVEPARTVSNINFKVPADSKRPVSVLSAGAVSSPDINTYLRADKEHDPYVKIKLLLAFEKNFPKSVLLPRAYEDLVDLYIVTGKPDTAADFGEKMLVDDPENPWMLIQVSRAYGLSQSDLREAVRYGEKAVTTIAKLKTLPATGRPLMFRSYTPALWTSTIAALDTSAKTNLAWVKQVVVWHQNAVNAAVHTRR